MTKDDLLNQLEDLIQLEVDATHAYDQAITAIDEQELKEKLIVYLGDHHRHIELLSAQVQELGGPPPELSSGFRGFLVFGSAALRSLSGTKGALEAMEINENRSCSSYLNAGKLDWPGQIRSIILANLADEQRHLAFICEALTTIAANRQETTEARA
jgi:hypothetical protein